MNTDESRLANLLDPPAGSPGLVRIDPRGIGTEIEDRLGRAQSDLRAAKLMYDNELYEWTVACSYYAMYHAVLAGLAQVGLRARTHHAAATAFEILFTRRSKLSSEFARQFRKAKQLERRYVEELNNVRQAREEAQYGLGRPVDEGAERVMTQAHGFVQAIEEVLA